MAEDMMDVLFDKEKITAENEERKMLTMEERAKADIRKALQLYLTQVFAGGDTGGSDFSATHGYAGIKGLIRKYQDELDKETAKDKK